MKTIKINAVTTLIKTLGFNREEKEELLKILQQDLGILPTAEPKEEKVQTTPVSSPSQECEEKEKNSTPPVSSPPQEYGEKQKLEMLFADGTTSFYRRRNQEPIAIILSGRGRKFGLYCREHDCPDYSSHDKAKKYAQTLPKVQGAGNWRILCTADCYVMRDCFRNLNAQLSTIGCRKIVESKTYGVLASDDNMRGAENWQVWFAIDL